MQKANVARQSPATVDALKGLINYFTSVIDLDMIVRSCKMFVKKEDCASGSKEVFFNSYH